MEKIKALKYYDIILVLFVAVLLISNIASTKILLFWKFTFDGGTLLFPFGYIFGDVMTEVYGYNKAKRAIWLGFFSAFLMSALIMIVAALPPAADWPYQESFKNILGLTPRIVLASLIAYWCGNFTNSYILARMKLLTKGRCLWTRTIGSTLIGEALDTVLFVSIAFAGALPIGLLTAVAVSNYIFKCGVEIIFTPITYQVVRFLKTKEGEDCFDNQTNFNPFKVIKNN
jgi:queuosine precursor transporter